MPKTYRAAVDLAPLLDGNTAGELIPELATRGLQQLIELGSLPFWVPTAMSAAKRDSATAMVSGTAI